MSTPLATGLGQGQRAASWAALGCTFGILPHLQAAILGLAAVLHTSAILFQTVKFAGVAYLLYLAWQMVKSKGAPTVSATKKTEPGPRTARRGALINVLDPKLSIFFLALLPPLLTGDPATAMRETAPLGEAFMAMTLGIFLLYGFFVATAHDWVLSNARLMRWLNRSFATILAALTGRLALERA